MVESGKVSLDTSTASAAGEITLTTEINFTLYTTVISGGHHSKYISIETSPVTTGDVWYPAENAISCNRQMTIKCVAKRARIRVIETDGTAGTTDAYLLAT